MAQSEGKSGVAHMLYQNKTIRVFIVGLIFLTIVSCQLFSLEGEKTITGDYGYYLINPDTILDDIRQGKIDIFTAQNATPQPPLSNSLSTVQWSEADYFSIMSALHKFVWNETIEEWKIRYASFSMECDDVSNGPQVAYFILYKIIQTGEQESRLEHELHVDPSNNSVRWSEVEFEPNLVNQYPIELSGNKVSIRDALQIAEENGGEDARLQADNECKVQMQFINSWRVSYVKVLDLFNIDIDASTGESKIIN